MKTLITLWMANRLGGRARDLRRSLRDYQRHECARIFALEQRSRGLRLYAAWIRGAKATRTFEERARLLLPAVTDRAFHDPVKAAA